MVSRRVYRTNLWPVLAFAMTLWPIASHASTGGPQLVRMLGYEAATERVWFEIEHYDEGIDWPAEIRYFELLGKTPVHAIRSAFVERRWRADINNWEAHVTRFSQRLTPLDASTVLPLVLDTSILSSDNTDTGCSPRSRVLTVLRMGNWSWSDTLTTFLDPRVVVAGVFRIPSPRRELVAVLAFRGIGYEECYEKQIAILLPPGWGTLGGE